MANLLAYWCSFYRNLLSLGVLLLASLFSASHLQAQDYYEKLQQELADSFNLPQGEFFFGTTEAEAMSKFYMEGMEYTPPADTLKRINVDSGEGVPFTEAVRVTSSGTKSFDWSLNFKAPLGKAVKEGDVLLLVVWCRAIDSRDERGLVSARTLIGDFSSYESFTSAVGPQWRKQYFGVVANADLAADNDKVLQFFLGDRRQTMDCGGLALINYGNSVTVDQLPKTIIDYNYAGREASAPWRAEADARIDQLRKSNLTVIVKDSVGNLVKDAQVEVHMKRHAFKFGCLVVDNNELLNNKKYQEIFLENFTLADVNSKFNIYDDKNTLQQTDEVVNFLRSKGLKVRMNTLVYPQFIPSNEIDTPEEATESFNTHLNYVKNVAGHFKGRIESHNVLNEAGPFPQWENKMKIIFPEQGRMYAEFFKAARAADPNAILEENGFRLEGANLERSYKVDSSIIAWGGTIDALGEEFHLGVGGLTPPEDLLKQLDRAYDAFKLPLRATEFDIDADITDPVQVAVQADYTRDFYTTLFSHAAIDEITAWGCWEPTMWNTAPNGKNNKRAKAWWTNDFEITPVGQAYRDVVFGKYWSNEKGTTNENGEYLVRVFKGTHEVVASQGTVQNRMVVSFVNDSTVVIQLFPDKEAPSQPQNLTATNTSTTATLSWEPATDNIKVIGYDVYQGNTKVNTTDVTGTAYKVTGLSPITDYSFYVVAKDTAGNQSMPSEIVTLKTDSLKLYLKSVCSDNPLATRRWEVKSGFDTTVVYRWAIKGTLQAGVDTVEANAYATFEATNTGATNTAEITWLDPDGTIKNEVSEAAWDYCPTTIRLDNDNYSKTQVYKYKSISGFTAAFRVHTFFNNFSDIHYYISSDSTTWTEITVARQGAPEDVGGGWTLGRYVPENNIPAGTNYLKIEVVGGTQDWATFLDWIEISYDPTPEAIACSDCIEVVDKLDDWTKSYAHTNWYFVRPAPGSANEAGDLSLVARGSTGTEHIIYNYKNMQDFAATLIYHASFPVTVKLYTSADNVTYTEAAIDFTGRATSGGWFKRVYTPQDSLPAGTNFVKLEVSGGTQNWTPSVSQVNILYKATPCTDCAAASDSLNDWSKSYSHTNWYLAQDAQASANFAGDQSRAVRNTTGTESIVWKYNQIQDFNAAFIYHTTFPAEVKFYTSPDNVTYTEIPAEHTSSETGGGWFRFVYTPTAAVPEDTHFLKIEVSGGTQAWTPQLSQVNILYQQAPAVVLPLTLTSVCSDDPAVNRRWRIRNENSFAVPVNWTVYGTDQAGAIMAPAGDSYFLTNTVANSPNTTIISWVDEAGTTQQNTKASSGARCNSNAREAEAELELAIEAAPNPAVSHFILTIPARGEKQAQVLIHNAMGASVYEARHALQEGVNRVSISTKGMAEGIQVVRVVVGKRQAIKKVLVTR